MSRNHICMDPIFMPSCKQRWCRVFCYTEPNAIGGARPLHAIMVEQLSAPFERQSVCENRAAQTRIGRKQGGVTQLSPVPPARSVVVNLDKMGRQAAKSYPGQMLVHQADGQRRVERARHEPAMIDVARATCSELSDQAPVRR
jgi:hypothetical protein